MVFVTNHSLVRPFNSLTIPSSPANGAISNESKRANSISLPRAICSSRVNCWGSMPPFEDAVGEVGGAKKEESWLRAMKSVKIDLRAR